MLSGAGKFYRLYRPAELGGQIRIAHGAQEFDFPRFPRSRFWNWFERGNPVIQSLLANFIVSTPQAAGQFIISHRAEQQDFPPRPTSRAGLQRDAQLLPHRHDFLDCAASALGQDRVGNLSQQLKFVSEPGRTPAALRKRLFINRHTWTLLYT